MSAPKGKIIKGDPFAFAAAEHAAPSKNWHDRCQDFTHSAFGVPSDGTPSAAEAWKRAKYKHPETNPLNIPRGVPTFWTGGSAGDGHAVVSRGGGSCWGTDLVRDGQVDTYPISAVTKKWGLTLVGWTEDIDGVRVWEPVEPKPKPAPKPANPGTNVTAARKSLRKAKAKAKNPTRRAAIQGALDSIRKLFGRA